MSLKFARCRNMLDTLRGIVLVASVSNFERVGTGGERVLIFVTDSRRDAVKLQADAGSAGPSVRGGSIALDLAASASLTGAHN